MLFAAPRDRKWTDIGQVPIDEQLEVGSGGLRAEVADASHRLDGGCALRGTEASDPEIP